MDSPREDQFDHLATRDELHAVRDELKSEIAEVRSELKSGINEARVLIEDVHHDIRLIIEATKPEGRTTVSVLEDHETRINRVETHLNLPSYSS